MPTIVGALALLYFGYEVERQRHKLRQIFNVFDREESEIAAMLETMVESGQLKPYVPERASVNEGDRASRTTTENQIAMTASRVGKPSSSSRVGVSWSDGVIRLRDEDLFGKQLGDLCVVFLRRVFALGEVKWVEIDRDQSTAEIHYDPGRFGLTDLLQRLAAAIRGQFPPDAATVLGQFRSTRIFLDPPAGSRSSDLARSSRLGTSSMTDPGGSGSATRRFVGDAALASRISGRHRKCLRSDRVQGLAGHRQRAHPI